MNEPTAPQPAASPPSPQQPDAAHGSALESFAAGITIELDESLLVPDTGYPNDDAPDMPETTPSAIPLRAGEWDQLHPILQRAIAATLRQSDRPNAELTLVLTGDDEVRTLNRAYRQIDAPTDVLSFPMQETPADAPGLVIAPEAAAVVEHYLGDIVIALPYSRRQAHRYANSIQDELCLLAVHGTLHLLGYDHDTPTREASMWAVQDAVLTAIGAGNLSRREFDDTDSDDTDSLDK